MATISDISRTATIAEILKITDPIAKKEPYDPDKAIELAQEIIKWRLGPIGRMKLAGYWAAKIVCCNSDCVKTRRAVSIIFSAKAHTTMFEQMDARSRSKPQVPTNEQPQDIEQTVEVVDE